MILVKKILPRLIITNVEKNEIMGIERKIKHGTLITVPF